MSNECEVARLLEKFDNEYNASFQALHRKDHHQFVNGCYDRIGDIQDELGKIVGGEIAARMIVERMNKKK